MLTLVVIASIAAFGVLSAWQWHRAQSRAADAAAMAAAGDAAPAAWTADVSPWQPVRVSGRYRADGQVLVRNRPQDGRAGFWVLTPVLTVEGIGWVNRGWMPATAAAAAVVTPPKPPMGEVDLVGQWQPTDRDGWVDPAQLPPGQVTAVDVERLTSQLDAGPSLPGYLVLTASDAVQPGLEPVVAPMPDASKNISYAVQWLIFAVIAVTGWGYLLRRETREARSAQEN